MIIEGIVGPQTLSAGQQARAGLDRSGTVLASEFNARYYNLVKSGVVFSTDSGSVTVTATVNISPLPANTGVPLLMVYNPINSGKDLVILKFGVATVSGTPGGPLLWNYVANQAITATPTAAGINSYIGSATASVAKTYNNTAITGSTAGIYYRAASPIAAVAAAGNTGITGPYLEPIDGEIVVPQNTGLLLAATATGTSHVIRSTLVWAELPA